MKAILLAIMHKLIVQFGCKPQKTKMLEKKLSLDGSEHSMIPIIKHDAYKLSFGRAKKLVPLEEFSAGTGISDLTIFTVDDRILSERRSRDKKPVTSKNQIQVLLAILNNPDAMVSVIAAQTHLSKSTVQKIIAQLAEEGLIRLVDGRYSAAYSIASSMSENIIAIEAKVRDWRSGLRQAMRYKEYADYSYLALYEENVAACLKNIDIFERFGIGLIGVSDEGIKIHLEAPMSDMTTTENKVLAFERFYSVIDERHESFVARNGFASNNTA